MDQEELKTAVRVAFGIAVHLSGADLTEAFKLMDGELVMTDEGRRIFDAVTQSVAETFPGSTRDQVITEGRAYALNKAANLATLPRSWRHLKRLEG